MRHFNSARYVGKDSSKMFGNTIHENGGNKNRYHWKMPCTAGFDAVIIADSQLRSIRARDVPKTILGRYRGASFDDVAFLMAYGYGPNINKPIHQHRAEPRKFFCKKCKMNCYEDTTLILAVGTNDLLRKIDAGETFYKPMEFARKWAETNKLRAIVFADIPDSQYFDAETQGAVQQYRYNVPRLAENARVPCILQERQNWEFEPEWVHVTPSCARQWLENLQELITRINNQE